LSRRAAGLTWLALVLTSICLGWVLPDWGEAALRRIHFEHPDDATRARALRIRALSRWESSQQGGNSTQGLVSEAEADLEEADRLDADDAQDSLRRVISGSPD
jgi:hypothetical protein